MAERFPKTVHVVDSIVVEQMSPQSWWVIDTDSGARLRVCTSLDDAVRLAEQEGR